MTDYLNDLNLIAHNSINDPVELEDDDLEYEDEDENDLDDVTEEDDDPISKEDIRDDPRIIRDPFSLD